MAIPPADLSFLEQSAVAVAPRLLGWQLVYQSSEGIASGRIVETEAYMGAIDPASHAFRGQTARNAVMFGPAGHAYIYFTYGRHYCMNVVTGDHGEASAVLIRALEPLSGLELMMTRRHSASIANLCNGPGKLTQALGLGPAHNGADLKSSALRLLPGPAAAEIIASPRIGISAATAQPWRFSIKDNSYVSRPRPKTNP